MDRGQFGNGPRSSASLADWSCAFSLMKAMSRSPRSSACWLSYGMPIRKSRSAQPMTPRPIRRFAFTVSSISGSGYGFTSMTSSRNRTDRRTTRSSSVPVDGPLPVRLPAREHRDVDRAEVARLVREERLLAARVGRLDQPDLRRGVRRARVDPVEEDHARDRRCARRPARSGRRRPGPGAGPPPRRCAALIRSYSSPFCERVHEPVGRRDRDVEVGDAAVELALDELEDVRVVDPEDPHVGAAPGAALLHRLGRAVEHAQEGHRARRPAAGGARRRRPSGAGARRRSRCRRPTCG